MRRSIVLIGILAITGCNAPGGGGLGDGGTGGTISAADFFNKVLGGLCSLQKRCANISTDACLSLLGATNIPDLDKAVKAGRVKYDATKAQACIDFYTALSCEDLARGLTNGIPNPCKAAITGTVPGGGACYDSIDCAAGTCSRMNNACPGKCVDYAAANGDCTMGGSCDGGAGYRCIAGRCAMPGGAGAVCGTAADCTAGLACIGGKCATPGGLRAPCKTREDCAAGLYCEPGTMVGQSMCATQVAAGGACGSDLKAFSVISTQCAGTLVCAGAQVGAMAQVTPGRCAPPSELGGPCTEIPQGANGIAGCLLGLACSGGKCVVPPTTGPCLVDAYAPCKVGAAYCDKNSKTCQPLKADGAACTGAGECQSRNCDNMVCAPANTCKEA